MLYILIAILMLGILIALHEFGHFMAAKACGVKVNEFAIGMGPRLFHKQVGETEYTLRALPIGGFCAMEGEGEAEETQDPRAFPNRPAWQRLIILLAGVTMNFLTGAVIILCLFSSVKAFSVPVISSFTEGWTAQEQGLRVGDQVLKVDGHAVYQTGDIGLYLSRCKGDTVDLTLKRDGKRVELKGYRFFALTDPDTGAVRQYYLGINASVVPNTPLRLLQQTWYQCVDYVRMVWLGLGDLITGHVGVRDMTGIVGMVDMMGEMGEEGAQAAEELGMAPILGALMNIFSFGSFVSINLGVMNLLPIPALDGGQIFFLAVDQIYGLFTRKHIDPKYLSYINMAGLICLLILMLVIGVSDVFKLFGR